jgi:cytochrome c6
MKVLNLATVLVTSVLLTASFASAQNAETLYKSKCAACHGPDGTGSTTMGKKLAARDFHSPEVTKMTDAELFDITKKGKNKMPAYDKKLTDDQIKDLIKYVRSLGKEAK